MARLIMITKGLLVRAIFSISSITSVWGAVTVKNNTNFWLLLNTSGLLFVEAAFTFSRKRMGEWKWFCPSVFLYLLASLPSIWLIELQLMNERKESFDVNHYCPSSDEIHTNVTKLHAFQDNRITIPLELTSQSWSVALQQQLIFVLILGRWMLPKGKLTRDQLSQLLLVYIGIAADILEFSTEGLKLKEVRCRYDLTICILGIWNWSLLQFAIGLTVTKARKPRVAGLGLSQETKHPLNPVAACCETEVWGIMATIIMQDGPFLAMRLYLVIEIEARQHMMIFFTCKNILIILLQLYRLAVIYLERPHHGAHHFMQQTFARYRGHTFRSSGGSQGETETKIVRKKPNNTMKQTTSKQKLLMSPNDPIAEQSEPLMKNTNERQEKRRPRSMQKRSPSDSVSRKKVNNDVRPVGPKQTSIPPSGRVRAPPKEQEDATNPKARVPERRGSNKPKNTDESMKSNLKKPEPGYRQNSPSSALPAPRQKRSTDTSPSLGHPSGKPIERVNFAFPEDSDNSDNKLARRKQSGKAVKPPETLPLNFLDSSKPRRKAGPSLASLDDEW